MAIAIKVENLGKKYFIHHENKPKYSTLREGLVDYIKTLNNRVFSSSLINNNENIEEFWALENLNFEIQQGDRVGIIGRNGAGKSTLLKILSRITEPTKGIIKIKGRIASLLEVGTGFHPELTGRENIFLNGSMLGMNRAEIKKKFDEIVDFAMIEKFIDTPVKRYSSGMYVRLAFAVAAHLEPEILVIDEVLAVGDAEFQKKCMGKMQEVSQNDGRTILFVSHNMQAISTLTQSAIFLDQGKVVFKGSTEVAISTYLSYTNNQDQIYSDTPSDKEPKITRVELKTSEPNNTQAHGKALDIFFEIDTPHSIKGAALSFQIFNSHQQPILHLLVMDSEVPICREKGKFNLVCHIPKFRIYPGYYYLVIHFAEQATKKKFQTIEYTCPFEVIVLGELRDYYWYPNAATYVEDSQWELLI